MKSLRVVGFVMIAVLLFVIVTSIPESTVNELFDNDIEFTVSDDSSSIPVGCDQFCDKPLDFDPQAIALDIINNIPESNDSTLVQLLDEAEIINVSDITISRVLGSSETDVSKLVLSKTLDFITAENEFVDLSQTNLSYSFSLKENNKIDYGSMLVEVLVNDKKFSEKRYDFSGNPVNGILKKSTDSISIQSLLYSSPDGIVKIELNVKEFYFRNDKGLYSLLSPVKIHSISLEKDSNQILYQSEEGKVVKVYPVDDTLRIFSVPS